MRAALEKHSQKSSLVVTKNTFFSSVFGWGRGCGGGVDLEIMTCDLIDFQSKLTHKIGKKVFLKRRPLNVTVCWYALTIVCTSPDVILRG